MVLEFDRLHFMYVRFDENLLDMCKPMIDHWKLYHSLNKKLSFLIKTMLNLLLKCIFAYVHELKQITCYYHYLTMHIKMTLTCKPKN